MLSLQSGSAITANVCDFFGVYQNGDELNQSELTRETEYENNLISEMKKYHLFDDQTPESLTTIIEKNVAPSIIEDAMLNCGAKGADQAKQFMKKRFVREREGKPIIPFSATISKYVQLSSTYLKLQPL